MYRAARRGLDSFRLLVLVLPLLLLSSASPALAQVVTDKELTVSRTPALVEPGKNITYTYTLTNHGPDPTPFARFSTSLPNNTTFVSFDAPPGDDVDTPPVGGSGDVDWEPLGGTMAAGEVAVFTLVIQVLPSVTTGTVISASAGVQSNNDPDLNNNAGVRSDSCWASRPTKGLIKDH